VLRLALCGLAVVLAMSGGAALAGTERYDYDALGRLVRAIDEQGRVTEYVYDPAGNILRVIVSGAGSALAPAVTSISPGSIRRGETRSFVVTGTGLTGARLSTTDPALEITALQTSATQITFDLTVLSSAPLGAHVFPLANAVGSASVQVSVNPVLPVLGLSPQPVALVLGGAPRNFTVTLSSADNIDHVVSVASADPAVVTVSPPSITFIAGQTEAVISIAPQSLGNTTIDLTAATLAAASFQAGVGPVLVGEAVTVTRPVSVHLRAPTAGAPSGNAMSVARAVSVHLPAATPGAPSGNAMSVAQPVSVHLPAVTPGAPAGNAMSVAQPVSVHLPAVTPGAPAGNAMSVTQPVSVSMP
jgi:YD repeat-containing protein